VTRVISDTIRPYDVCVRYAGDDFIVVLSNCGGEEAAAKSAELQDAVERLAFEATPGHSARVSISAGAAVFPADGETYEALLATADGRMYRDKKSRKVIGFQPRAGRGRDAKAIEDPRDPRALALVGPTSTRVN
jgi:diguanylate cyclase (GGDEF)-like protein